MSNKVRGQAKKGNAPPQDFSGMQHHMGGIPAHSQPPQHMQTYMQPEQMTMAPNDMNQQTYNVQTMPPRQRRTVVNPSMTLPPAAQVQQDNQNGQNMYTVNIPQHSYPSHQMMTQPPPHGTYQPYTPYQHQPMPPYQQPVFQPIPQTHQMQPVFQPPPQRTQPPQSHRPRKVLKITNPETNSVVNDKEVAQAESATVPATSTAAESSAPPTAAAAAPVATPAPVSVEQPTVTETVTKPVATSAAAPEAVPARTASTTAVQQRFRAEIANRAFSSAAESKDESQEAPRPVEEQTPAAVAVESAPQQVTVAESQAQVEATDPAPVAASPEQPTPVVEVAADLTKLSLETPAPAEESTPAPEVAAFPAAPAAEEEAKADLSRQTSEAPVEDERTTEEKHAALVKKHEDNIVSLREDSSVNLLERVYGRTYMYAIRDVVVELNHVQCKLTEEELKKFGVDRATMPPADNKKRHEPNFVPNWLDPSGNPRKKYAGRGSGSDTRGYGRHKKNPPMTRPSIERSYKNVEPTHKAENAWKPAAKMKTELDENKKLFKDVRGLLNKITPTTYPELSQEFIKYEVYMNDEIRSTVIDIIFDKAVEEPKFCPLYSDLCELQTREEFEKANGRNFRGGILQKCQKTFEGRDEKVKEDREKMENETDEKKKAEMMDAIKDNEKKEKRRVIGNLGFIGQLYRHSLITPSILNWCVVHLLRTEEFAQQSGASDEESIECAVKMLSCVGKTWESATENAKKEFPLETYVNHLYNGSSSCSNRVKFMIHDLVDLKNRNWIPRKGADSGPKTITDIHMEAKNEEIQNKVARDNYNERRGLGNSRSKDFSQSGRRNYGGRPSDKRAPISAVPVDRSLKKCEPQTSLSAAKTWAGGAGGGGVQGSSFTSSKRGVGSLTAAIRNADSQNSSREQSESRKNSVAFARASSVKPAEATNGGASPSQPNRENDEELQSTNKKIVIGVRNDLNEYMEQSVSIDEAFESVQDRCKDHSVPVVFMNFISVGGEEPKPDSRKHLGQMLARCLSEKEMREEALFGITAYCNFVVRTELWNEVPNVWEFVADVFRHAILCDGDVFDGARPSIADFDSAFLAANGDQRKPYRLLISLLQKLINDDDHNIASMAFQELKEEFRNEPVLRAALEQEKTNGSQHTNLYALLNAQ